MIKIEINYSSNTTIKRLKVFGHTFKNDDKIEPACACVSNIVLGFVNWIKNNKVKNLAKIIIKDGYVDFQFIEPEQLKKIVELIVIQLKMTANYFPKKIILKTFR